MATSSILGGEPADLQPDGKSIARLGPSDNSDSGSDASAGTRGMDNLDTDSAGTGERASVDDVSGEAEGGDILPDRIVSDPNAPGGRKAADEARDLTDEISRSVDA